MPGDVWDVDAETGERVGQALPPAHGPDALLHGKANFVWRCVSKGRTDRPQKPQGVLVVHEQPLVAPRSLILSDETSRERRCT